MRRDRKLSISDIDIVCKPSTSFCVGIIHTKWMIPIDLHFDSIAKDTCYYTLQSHGRHQKEIRGMSRWKEYKK